jgi:monoamine oxidase
MSHYTTLIIGAGAAGLAAGRALWEAGHQNILILEARARIGGRVWTDYDLADFPIELGAEFIHGERTAAYALSQAAGLRSQFIPRLEALHWSDGQGPALPHQQLSRGLQTRLARLIAASENMSGIFRDQSLQDYLEEFGYGGEALMMADVLLAQTWGVDIDALSCHDMIREQEMNTAGGGDFRLIEGYGRLLDWYAQGLPIRLDCPVKSLEWNPDGVLLTTPQGDFQAQKCLITLPVSLLRAKTLSFSPPLSAEKQRALDSFYFEPATKQIYVFRQAQWEPDLSYLGQPNLTARWWTPSYGREGQGVMTAYATASRARQLDGMSEAAALDLGLKALSKFIRVNVRHLEAELLSAKRVSWATEPYTRGGYATVVIGRVEARHALANPEGGVLFFAGEATAYQSQVQTVHGALESGWRAAREILNS